MLKKKCVKKVKELLEELRIATMEDIDEHKERMTDELDTTWDEIENDKSLSEFSLWLTLYNLRGRLAMLDDLITEVL